MSGWLVTGDYGLGTAYLDVWSYTGRYRDAGKFCWIVNSSCLLFPTEEIAWAVITWARLLNKFDDLDNNRIRDVRVVPYGGDHTPGAPVKADPVWLKEQFGYE